MEILAYVGRHASTENNDAGKLRGHLKLPLSTKGIEEAKETTKFLKTLRPAPSWVVTSDLPSAKQTGAIYARSLGIRMVRPMKDLRGMDIGDFAGKSKEEMQEDLEEAFQHPDEPCGGAEKPRDFDKRNQKVFSAIIETGKKAGSIPLIVAHGSNTVFLTKDEQSQCNYQEPPVKPAGILKVIPTEAVPIYREDIQAKPIPIYPADHEAGMAVPKGGSNCMKCEYLARNQTDCTNKYFIAWNGSEKIPGEIDSYCSDWFEPKEGVLSLA